jgi:hypothetical protein
MAYWEQNKPPGVGTGPEGLSRLILSRILRAHHSVVFNLLGERSEMRRIRGSGEGMWGWIWPLRRMPTRETHERYTNMSELQKKV